jgi:hypothetical protein
MSMVVSGISSFPLAIPMYKMNASGGSVAQYLDETSMHFNLLVVAAILAIVSATPSTFDQVHPFIPPTSTDVRSPCPGLNT